MKKLLILVLVAALCLPCYGTVGQHNILVYKLTCSFNPMIEFTDGTWSQAAVGTLKINAYLVLDIDLTGDPFLNQDPGIIFYGKDGTAKWSTSFILSESSDEVGFNIFDIDDKGHQGIYLYIDEEDNYAVVHNIYCCLYGKIGPVDIGFVPKVKKNVPSSLKGNVDTWADTGDNFEAFGNVTATLDSKYTKPANKLGQTRNDVCTAIVNDLSAQGYH